MSQYQSIAIHIPTLQAIAMRMVGSMHDAEDIVQDTLLKWLTIDTSKIHNTKAYLIKAVTNNCINHLNALKSKKDECLDSIRPQELIDRYKESELLRFDLDNEVKAALDIIHKKLEPVEKGIFVLREMFGYEYEELQALFNKKKDNCRQLFSRAKAKLDEETSKLKSEMSKTNFIESFKKACEGNVRELLEHIHREQKN